MQARKQAAPALPESFFVCGVAVPPAFGGFCVPACAVVLPPLEAGAVSAGRVMTARAMIAIPTVRYMSVSLFRRPDVDSWRQLRARFNLAPARIDMPRRSGEGKLLLCWP